MKTNSVKMLYFFRRSWLTQTLRGPLREELRINPLSAKVIKWSNTLKQIVVNLPTICLSVFEHFMNLALKGLRIKIIKQM